VQPLLELPGGGSLGGSDPEFIGRLPSDSDGLCESDRLASDGCESEPLSDVPWIWQLPYPLAKPIVTPIEVHQDASFNGVARSVSSDSSSFGLGVSPGKFRSTRWSGESDFARN